jgi:hypothetical protein
MGITVIDKQCIIILVAVIIIVGFTSAIYLYGLDKYSLLYYGDAVSHLVKAREFVDSTNPGLVENLGTVWLPIPHFLLLPFSLIDPLFESGFAGLAVSLPCIAITSIFLYRMIKMQTGILYIGLIGALVYISNPNIIYIGITAMTEAPFMLFFVASAYYFQKWYQNLPKYLDIEKTTATTSAITAPITSTIILQRRSWRGRFSYFLEQFSDLIKCSISLSLATLCRYEGWIIPIFLVIFVILSMVFNRRYDVKYKVSTLLISIISLSGMIFWLLWNDYYYGDLMEFVNADYWSASFQAHVGGNRAYLYLQPFNVISVFSITALFMYGPVLSIAAIIGYIFHIYDSIKEDKRKRNILYLFLTLPQITTIFSMVMGVGEMNLSVWYNSRFLILLSPLIILLISILLVRLSADLIKKNNFVLTAIIASLFIYQLATPAFGVVITFLDAKAMISPDSRTSSTLAADTLRSIYTGGKVLIITGSAQDDKIMQQSGIPLKNFDTILEDDTCNTVFKKPWLHANYIVLGKNPDPDAANVSKYWLNRQADLYKYFGIVYDDKYYILMRKSIFHP